jgi:tryptophan aminotransferase
LDRGDPVLLEAPLYAGVLPCLKAIDAVMVGELDRLFFSDWITLKNPEVDVDSYGLSAENLEKVLSEWPADKIRPKVV